MPQNVVCTYSGKAHIVVCALYVCWVDETIFYSSEVHFELGLYHTDTDTIALNIAISLLCACRSCHGSADESAV